MYIYLDDVRNVKDTYPDSSVDWKVIRTAGEAIKLLATGEVEFISFDHDLGTELTGYDVACFIEEQVYYGKIKCPDYMVHSANPVGRQNIWKAMQAARNF